MENKGRLEKSKNKHNEKWETTIDRADTKK